jgi:hypothetical protein
MPGGPIREFIYLDFDRVRSLAAQLNIPAPLSADRADRERVFFHFESAVGDEQALRIDSGFDFARWDKLPDGQLVWASGVIRLLDYAWLATALNGLPAVLRKMSKIEMTALRNSDEGRRMSKSQLQQRSQENQAAIAQVEEMKVGELSDVVRQLYSGSVRIKLRPNPEHPRHVLMGSADLGSFYDSAAGLTQKYGIEIDAGWTVVGQLNVPNLAAAPQPVPVGNQMEDAFEQVALLMNNAFRLANAPAPPALSFTPIAIYRSVALSSS